MLEGPVSQPENLKYEGNGAFDNAVVKTEYLPEPVILHKGGFVLEPKSLSLMNMGIEILNSSMTVSGAMNGLKEGPFSINMEIDGALSQKAAAWLKSEELIPAWVNIAAPVLITDGRVDRKSVV